MIISRRKIHLYASIALAVILPIIFIAGICFRPTYATVTEDTETLLSRSVIDQPQANNNQENPITAFLAK